MVLGSYACVLFKVAGDSSIEHSLSFVVVENNFCSCQSKLISSFGSQYVKKAGAFKRESI